MERRRRGASRTQSVRRAGRRVAGGGGRRPPAAVVHRARLRRRRLAPRRPCPGTGARPRLRRQRRPAALPVPVRRRRPAPGRRAWLPFDGLFYQGDVWLDGGYLGDTEGYFLPHGFEVTERPARPVRARPGRRGHLHAAARFGRQAEHHRDLPGRGRRRPDVEPRGIWRPVRLSETGPVRIASLRVMCAEATPERAGWRCGRCSTATPPGVVLRTEVGGLDHELPSRWRPGRTRSTGR